GSIDSSFGFGGVAITSFVGDAKACGVAIQADGKIVAAGQVMQAGVAHVAVARYRRDGSLDPSFGGDGRVTAAKYMAGQSVALQRNGKILVGGGEIYGMGVARFLAGGSLDRTFGREGVSGVGPGEPQGGEPPAVYSGSYGLAIRGS